MIPRTVVALAALLIGSTAHALPGAALRSGRGPELVPGEVLVKFKAAASPARRQGALAALGHGLLAPLGKEGWVRVQTAPGQSVAEALAAYAENPDVEYAQPNFVYHATVAPNDPLYPFLWGLENTGQSLASAPVEPGAALYPVSAGIPGDDMRLERAWGALTDCSSVVVAVVDTGVNYLHQDLAGNMWGGGAPNPNHGKNFADAAAGGDDATMDLNGHGTHVAGTIGAVGNNGLGTTGVCWKASIMAVRVLDASGSGSTAAIIQGIDFAVANGAKVVNMSLGGGGFDAAFEDAIVTAQAADVVVVVAAGNDGSNNDVTNAVYPCNFTQPNLVCVAALDQSYQLASFSNWGATSVDLGAPGTNVVSTWPGPTIGDPLTSGWTFSTTTSGGWHYFTTQSGLKTLLDGSLSGTYQNSTDDRAWKTFDLSGATNATLHFYVVLDLAGGDGMGVAWASTVADPFASGTFLGAIPGPVSTWPAFAPAAADVSGSVGATCTIGFQLFSDAASQTSHGAGVAIFTIATAAASSATYNVESGTSMASPAVAGLAAMLRAYNPSFTYADVVAALKGGGRSVGALFGKVTTGKAADAMGSLAFIQPPTGLAYAVQ
jgi:thermitase